MKEVNVQRGVNKQIDKYTDRQKDRRTDNHNKTYTFTEKEKMKKGEWGLWLVTLLCSCI